MNVDTRDLISITDANRKGVSGLVADAESGRAQVLIRHNKPIAAVVGLDVLNQLQKLEELESDLRLLAIALIRTAADTGRRMTFAEVLAKSGISRKELEEED